MEEGTVLKFDIRFEEHVTANGFWSDTHRASKEECIAKASELTEADGVTRYITQVISVVKPVKVAPSFNVNVNEVV